MRVRGAPAIGIAAAYTLAVVAHSKDGEDLRASLQQAGDALIGTRPTAVNLSWAVERVLAAIEDCPNDEAVRAAVLAEAQRIHEEQIEADLAMAEAGAALVPPGSTVITHCNTGPLATGGLGTALGVVIEAHRQGRVVEVLVDETRPRLQGARLTSWELLQHDVPHHVIADGAAAALMSRRPIAAAFVGADRIAANGDTANKVGTYGLAIACRHHGVPFYVVAPVSTIDPRAADGSVIPVEERDEAEVLSAGLERLAPEGAHALNPAFDVTPADLITAIVTERGVLRPPFGAAIAGVVSGMS
jgi:methylthioribose-1-phosphate isomerase